MAEQTIIPNWPGADKGRYWEKGWRIVEGCTPCSPGCQHCWALAMERRFRRSPGEGCIRLREDRLEEPLRRRKPTAYAVWNDLFHEQVPDDFILRAFEVMREAKRHTFLVLTKRSDHWHILKTVESPNIWLGMTAENIDAWTTRVYWGPPVWRWLSLEPLLERL